MDDKKGYNIMITANEIKKDEDLKAFANNKGNPGIFITNGAAMYTALGYFEMTKEKRIEALKEMITRKTDYKFGVNEKKDKIIINRIIEYAEESKKQALEAKKARRGSGGEGR